MPIFHLPRPGRLTSGNFDAGPKTLDAINKFIPITHSNPIQLIKYQKLYNTRMHSHGADFEFPCMGRMISILPRYICDSRRLCFQPVFSSRHSTFAMKTCCQHFLFSNSRFSTAPYIYCTDIINRSMKRVSRSTLSVPVGPIGRQNSTYKNAKFYCIDDHERN